MLRLAGEGDVRVDWPNLLPSIAMAYRQSVHEATGYSPFMLEHGREMELASVSTWNTERLPTSARKLLNKLKFCREEAKKILEKEIRTRNERLSSKKKSVKFEVGDMVWYHEEVKGDLLNLNGAGRDLQKLRGNSIIKRI
jgi:hypothetical protein